MAEKFVVPGSGCKAIADVRGLWVLHHGENEEPAFAQLAKSADWKSLFTLRGSVNINQDNPTLDKILVDQFDTPVAITSEPGDFTIEANLPSFALNDLKAIFNDDTLAYEATDLDGLGAVGLNIDGKMYDASFLVKTATGHLILFSHVQFTLSFAKDDKTFYVRLNGSVVAPTNASNKTMYIACEKKTAQSAS